MSIGQILKEFNTTRYQVEKLLKEFNIPKNPELNDNLKNLPLQKISKDEFYQLYTIEGKSYNEIAEIYNVTVRQLKRLNSKYKCHHKIEDSVALREKTFTQKYGEGIKSARQIKEVQDRITTNYEEKYGVKNPSQNIEVQKKRKQTFIEKYGVENPFASDIVKEKIRNFYKDKYGEDIINPSQVPEINQRITRSNRYTMGIKYGHSKEEIDIIDSADKLHEFILSLPKDNRNAISIGKLLNFDDTTIGNYIHKYHLEDIVDLHRSSSSYEEEIYQYLSNLGITNISRNIRNILPENLELDLYLPDYKLGIEFNGNYWHSEKEKENNYHQKKSLIAENNGIFVYHIYEFEWTNPLLQLIIKSQLSGILGKHSKKIYARKCSIQEINSDIKSKFLNENHFQGNDSSSVSLSLVYNFEIVAVMTFCKPRFSKKDDWELSRFCVKQNISVIGGASKLFKYFIDTYLKNNETVITYSDIGKATGKVYPQIGFEFVSISKPGYVWWKNHNGVKTRYQCQMKNEIETMQSQGYFRIFNSGNKVWRYKKEI